MHEMKENSALLQGLTLTYPPEVKSLHTLQSLIAFYLSELDGLQKHRSRVLVLFNL